MKKILFILFTFTYLSACQFQAKQIPNEWRQIPSSRAFEEINQTPPAPLKLIFFNVGQGNSFLIQSPSGKNFLYDAGAEGKGRSIILPYLQENHLSLEAILVSHYDSDHLGGVDEIIAGPDGRLGNQDDVIPRLGVFDRGGNPYDPSPAYLPYIEAIRDIRHTLLPGQIIYQEGEFLIRCLGANANFQNPSPLILGQGIFAEEENASSAAILIQYNHFKFLAAGDLTGGGAPGGFRTHNLEDTLLSESGEVSALLANHHGSLSSSNENFVQNIQAKAAIIQVGNDNPYHHPAQEVLGRFHNAAIDLWLTERGSGGFIVGEHVVNGNILLTTEGENFEINGVEYLSSN